MSSELKSVVKKIRLICLDVDGVLTDGRIIFASDGRETKQFNVQDGQGIRFASRAGYLVAIVTGKESEIVTQRARQLGIEHVYQGVKNKRAVFEQLLSRFELSPEEVLFMGDDLPDLPVMRIAGLSVAPANAVDEVKEAASLVTTRSGGQGAVREAMEWLLKNADKWRQVTARYE